MATTNTAAYAAAAALVGKSVLYTSQAGNTKAYTVQGVGVQLTQGTGAGFTVPCDAVKPVEGGVEYTSKAGKTRSYQVLEYRVYISAGNGTAFAVPTDKVRPVGAPLPQAAKAVETPKTAPAPAPVRVPLVATPEPNHIGARSVPNVFMRAGDVTRGMTARRLLDLLYQMCDNLEDLDELSDMATEAHDTQGAAIKERELRRAAKSPAPNSRIPAVEAPKPAPAPVAVDRKAVAQAALEDATLGGLAKGVKALGLEDKGFGKNKAALLAVLEEEATPVMATAAKAVETVKPAAAPTAPKAQCQGTTKEGGRCKRLATTGEFCPAHKGQVKAAPAPATPAPATPAPAAPKAVVVAKTAPAGPLAHIADVVLFEEFARRTGVSLADLEAAVALVRGK